MKDTQKKGIHLTDISSKTRVYLMGGDCIGWALDSDLSLVRRALEKFVEFTDLERCEVIHSVWWEPLVNLPMEKLIGKRVVCHFSGEPFRYLSFPSFHKVLAKVGCWIAQSRQAVRQLDSVGIKTNLIPYTIDTDVFYCIDKASPEIHELRRIRGIPQGCYLIGNFHRDTEGCDLSSPKLVKGPDLFVEIVSELKRRYLPIHIVLAGPRRMWIRSELEKRGVPFSYIGQPMDSDDIESNLLKQECLNELYNLLDLYLVSSRSEGGPRTILESIAAGTPVISTRVGVAEDLLSDDCLYSTCIEAVEKIERAIRGNSLGSGLLRTRERLLVRHTINTSRQLLAELYANINDIPSITAPIETFSSSNAVSGNSFVKKLRSNFAKYIPKTRSTFTVGLWHEYVSPPYGGGNQFMIALRKMMQQRGVTVSENQLSKSIDAYVLNSVHFDVERFIRFSKNYPIRMVHRIDGPIHLIRGADREKDELCFQLNKRFAAATVVQSSWTLQRIVEMGYTPVNPVIIHNGVDPDIFNRFGRKAFDTSKKIRLISSSWSGNSRKGGPIYKWLDENLDWGLYDYTFVGNLSEKLSKIRHISPVPSAELAEILREHDIYITASSNDPCSNAVIEALACGLPVLYLEDGGHPELVKHGGLPFKSEEDILLQLERLVNHYNMYQNLIVVSSMEEVVVKYLQLLRDISIND